MFKFLLICCTIFLCLHLSWAQTSIDKQRPLQKLLYVYYSIEGLNQIKVLDLDQEFLLKGDSSTTANKQVCTEEEHFKLYYSNILSNNFKLSIRAKTKIVLQKVKLELPHLYTPHLQINNSVGQNINYFCNGFQSWTTSQELTYKDKIPKLASLLNPYGQHLGDYKHYYKYPKKKGILHSWSFSYLRYNKQYAFVGSLNEHSGYTLFVHDTKGSYTSIQKDCKGLSLEANQSFDAFDLVFHKGTQAEVWEAYRNNFGPNPSKAKPAIGWTSWYNYYDKIDEKIILDNLNNFSEAQIPLDIFQIDDGYQSQIGDWLTCNKKFLHGMHAISNEIHNKGYKAGLWLAPFVASKKSKVFQEHPDWFVSDDKGKPLKVAINVIWKGPYYALDIYNEEVQAHLKKVIQTILFDWEYDMIKVDFLFAACLRARADKTRGQIMYDAMKLLREYAGDKLILGCGVPLAAAFHLVDYCRVGNDAHLAWEFGILKAFGNAERPSTWSTLTNTIMRFPLSGKLFLNDPDVFILRKENTKLSEEEKHTMLLLNNLLGAVVFSSDNIANYDSIQLQKYKSIFPYIQPQNVVISNNKQAYKIGFNVEKRNYLMLCNMSKKTSVFRPTKARYFDSQQEAILEIDSLDNNSIFIKAHASKLLYQIKGDAEIELLGGSNHLISGQEVKELKILASNSIILRFKEKAQTNGNIFFYVKDKTTTEIYINGKSCPVKHQIARYSKS